MPRGCLLDAHGSRMARLETTGSGLRADSVLQGPKVCEVVGSDRYGAWGTLGLLLLCTAARAVKVELSHVAALSNALIMLGGNRWAAMSEEQSSNDSSGFGGHARAYSA